MATAIPCPTFDWKAKDQLRAWDIFEAKAKLWLAGEKIEKKLQYTKIVLMLGDEGLSRWTKFKMEDTDSEDPNKVYKKFRDSLGNDVSYRTARATLYNNFRQKKDETANELDIRLSKLIDECKFPTEATNVKDFLKKDIFIYAVNYFEVQKWVLGKEDKDITHEKVLEECKKHESNVRDYLKMASENPSLQTAFQQTAASIDEKTFRRKGNKKSGYRRRSRTRSGSRERQHRSQKPASKCKRCGFTQHTTQDGTCPAMNTTCGYCNIKGHYESVCITKRKAQNKGQRHQRRESRSPARRSATPGPAVKAHTLTIKQPDSSQYNHQRLTFDNISTRSQRTDKELIKRLDTARDGKTFVLTELDIKLPHRNGRDSLLAKLDMGAETNILPLRTYQKMFPHRLLPDGSINPEHVHSTTLEFECNKQSIIRSKGCITLQIGLPGSKLKSAQFFISEQHDQILIGHPTCDKLKVYTLNVRNKAPKFDHSKLLPLLDLDSMNTTHTTVSTVEDLKKRYPNQFDIIGNFDGEYNIVTDETVPPVQHPMRKTPIEYQEKIEQELDRMVTQGIITPAKEPTEWVNSMTYPMKPNGDLRICLDPKNLNKAIIREHYKPPTLEEITHKLSGAKVFSKLDAFKGFFAYKLNYKSSLKTTFNTTPRRGRYRYLRMPMGAKCSQDAFQMKMDQILEGLDGVIAIHDDITVYGKDEEDHNKNMIGLMERATQTGLTFNSKKCAIKQKSVSFFGVTFSEKGMSPDPNKIQGILDMQAPRDVTQLQSFLGMVNFMHPFIPHLSANTAPLRQLLTKNAIFQWTASTNAAFQKLKSLIAEAQKRSLKFYNRNLPITVQADASQLGLGAALLQEGYPIAFASKTLSETEQRYANIERELLAVVFACERFRTYLLGREFIIESDHKPLEMIALKNLMAAPPRLQRMLLRLQPFDCTIKYRPGKEMLLVDALSRLPSPIKTPIELDLRIEHNGFTTEKTRQIAEETQKDSILGHVYSFTLDGWPERRNRVPRIARRFWDQRDELSIDHGLLLKGPRIVIPATLQDKTLQNLHTGHLGVQAMQQTAKGTVYWPGIDADIEDYVQRCTACLATKKHQKREPLLPHTIPDGPWQKNWSRFFRL